MSSIPNHVKELSEMEIFELMCAAFPEFGTRGDKGEDIWDQVMEEFQQITEDPALVLDLLSRMVYLAMPTVSPLTDKVFHVLGRVTVSGGAVQMQAAVKREVV